MKKWMAVFLVLFIGKSGYAQTGWATLYPDSTARSIDYSFNRFESLLLENYAVTDTLMAYQFFLEDFIRFNISFNSSLIRNGHCLLDTLKNAGAFDEIYSPVHPDSLSKSSNKYTIRTTSNVWSFLRASVKNKDVSEYIHLVSEEPDPQIATVTLILSTFFEDEKKQNEKCLRYCTFFQVYCWLLLV